MQSKQSELRISNLLKDKEKLVTNLASTSLSSHSCKMKESENSKNENMHLTSDPQMISDINW